MKFGLVIAANFDNFKINASIKYGWQKYTCLIKKK